MNQGLWPEFIIIDTLNYAVDGDENDNRYMGAVAKYLSALSNHGWHTPDGSEKAVFQPTVLLVHHTPKANFDTARGASALEGAIDTSLRLKEHDSVERLIEVWNKKNRYAPRGSTWHYTLRDGEHDGLAMGAALEYTGVADVAQSEKGAMEKSRDAVVQLVRMEGPIPNKNIIKRLEKKFAQSTLENAISKLKKDGVIAKQDASNRQSAFIFVDRSFEE